MPPGGYFGSALLVDLDGPASEPLALPDHVLRATIGGAGLGAHLLGQLAPAGVDPLAPEAPLAFVFSPLVGTPLTTSAKFAVVAKSPLTDRINDALAYLISIAVRWPLLGVIVASLRGGDMSWRKDPEQVRLYSRASWVWVALFSLRLAVQLPLYLASALTALGAARIAMGIPLFAVGIWLSWLILRPRVASDH